MLTTVQKNKNKNKKRRHSCGGKARGKKKGKAEEAQKRDVLQNQVGWKEPSNEEKKP